MAETKADLRDRVAYLEMQLAKKSDTIRLHREQFADLCADGKLELGGGVTGAAETHGRGVDGGPVAPGPCPTCGMPPRVESPDAEAKRTAEPLATWLTRCVMCPDPATHEFKSPAGPVKLCAHHWKMANARASEMAPLPTKGRPQ